MIDPGILSIDDVAAKRGHQLHATEGNQDFLRMWQSPMYAAMIQLGQASQTSVFTHLFIQVGQASQRLRRSPFLQACLTNFDR